MQPHHVKMPPKNQPPKRSETWWLSIVIAGLLGCIGGKLLVMWFA
jgi:hypothetical protein